MVYQKYRSNAVLDAENRLYSGLFINLRKIEGFNAMHGDNLTRKESGLKVIQETAVSDPTTLQFDSKYESGNLFAAFRVGPAEYDLILQNDINTKGNTQWFFFSVGNTVKDRTVKFNIVNLVSIS